MKETFLNYRNYYWLWFTVLVLLGSSVAYYLDNSIGGRNGGTILGYTLGVVATVAILYLMWYGIRKRSYYAKYTSLRSVLSSHIWIGIGLLFLVPLHSGFSFGLNVHTLAYALMVGTILSGIWGVFMFREFPYALLSQRGGGTTSQLGSGIYSLTQDIQDVVNSKRSDQFLSMAKSIDFDFKPSLFKSLRRKRPEPIDTDAVAKLLETIPTEEQSAALTLIELINKKRSLVAQVQDEARAQAFIRGWLLFHVPLSFGLCAALAIHILSVFYYH